MKNQEVFSKVTANIQAALEQGVKPWQCAWDRAQTGPLLPQNLATHHEYQGINIAILWSSALEHGYSSNWWLTFKQAQALGAHVRYHEKATQGVFYKPWVIDDEDDNGDVQEKTIPLAKIFSVFNLDQIDGLDDRKPTVNEAPPFSPIPAAEQIMKASGAEIREGGTRAYYLIPNDRITLPDRWRFEQAEDFYATALHELTHWTGHESRLNRTWGRRFGDQAYAFEELVAEMGSAFLVAKLGLKGELQHANYIDHWLKILKEDASALVKAAAMAQKAFELIYGFLETATAEEHAA